MEEKTIVSEDSLEELSSRLKIVVNSTFSEDLLVDILSRLTVRKLLKLRSASKSWCSLIDKYEFMKKHYQTQYSMLKEQGIVPFFADHPSVFGQEQDPLQFYLFSKAYEDMVVCLTPNLHRDCAPYFVNNRELVKGLWCVGLVNGVVLLHWEEENLGLWNPATREFKVLPRPRPNRPENVIERMGVFIGMGFDIKSNDFKVVRQIDWLVRNGDTWVTTTINEMYSLKSNSWKNLELPWTSLVIFDACIDGYYDGFYFWTVNDLDTSNCTTRHIWFLIFNFSTEIFKVVDPPPPGCQEGPKPEWSITKYMDFLAVIFNIENSEDKVWLFEVWIMSEFNDDDPAISLSWQHLLTIGPIQTFDGLWPTALLLDGDMLLTVKGGEDVSATISNGCETALYNPTTRTLKRLGVGLATCLRYVESLYPLSTKKLGSN